MCPDGRNSCTNQPIDPSEIGARKKRAGESGTGGIGERSVDGNEVGFGQEVVHALVRGPILLLLRQRGALVIDHLPYDQLVSAHILVMLHVLS
jgi:hypothetical protein